MNLNTIYRIYKEEIEAKPQSSEKKGKKTKTRKMEKKHCRTTSVIADAESLAVQSHYPENCDGPTSVNTEDGDGEPMEKSQLPLQSVEMKSIEANLNVVESDQSRIIEPGISLSGMHEFVPATKLKGTSPQNVE